MYSEIPDHPKEPSVWVRTYKGARVFYSMLGGWKDFENETFKTMIARALFWTAKREVEKK